MVKKTIKTSVFGELFVPPEAIQKAVAKIKASYKLQYISEKRVQCQS